MSLKTNEEKDIFEVLVDELNKDLKQAVNQNYDVMSSAKRKESMRFLIKAVKLNQTEDISMVDLNQIDERYCKAMSNACIYLSQIVVKTIDNIEKTVEYIRQGKDLKKREQDKEEEFQSTESIKSSDASLDTESHNSSTSTSISIKKIPEYGCSECFFKFRSFGLVKKHVEIFHTLSNKATILDLTKNQEQTSSILESTSFVSVNKTFNGEMHVNDHDRKVTSTLHKQITLYDKMGQQFLSRFLIKGFNGLDLNKYILSTTVNKDVEFYCLNCKYNCNRLANFKRHLIHHQSINSKLSLHDLKLLNLKKKKKNKMIFNGKPTKLAISNGSSRPSLRSFRSDSKSSSSEKS